MPKKKAQYHREALTNLLLQKARSARDAGEDRQFAVDHPRGLSVHVRGTEISYYVQARGPTADDGTSKVIKRRVCEIAAISFKDIKVLAAEVVGAIKAGSNPDAVIRTRLAGGDAKTVGIAVDRADAGEQGLWTFRQLIQEYLDRKDGPGSQKLKLRASSIREISDRLRDRPEAAGLMDRYVKELRLDDLEAVRDKIRDGHAGATSHAKFVDLAKRVLNWGHGHRRLKVGLAPEAGWWNALTHEHKLGDRSKRKLTPQQVGMLIAVVEAVRATEANTSDSVLGALQCSWLITQRSMALVTMKALASERNWCPDPLPERNGWRVYTWAPGDVKNDREIKLSVPPIAIDFIERVAASSEALLGAPSKWAFPQRTNKYVIRSAVASGGGVPSHLDRPITSSSLNHALDSLAGIRPGSFDVLSMVGLPRKIGPHDLRRSVTDYFDSIGEAAYASALLDHKVTGTDKMSREVAQVTQGVYSSSDRVIFKAEGLTHWMNAVLPWYDRAKTDPRLLKAVAARSEHLTKKRAEGGRKKGPRRTLASSSRSGLAWESKAARTRAPK